MLLPVFPLSRMKRIHGDDYDVLLISLARGGALSAKYQLPYCMIEFPGGVREQSICIAGQKLVFFNQSKNYCNRSDVCGIDCFPVCSLSMGNVRG